MKYCLLDMASPNRTGEGGGGRNIPTWVEEGPFKAQPLPEKLGLEGKKSFPSALQPLVSCPAPGNNSTPRLLLATLIKSHWLSNKSHESRGGLVRRFCTSKGVSNG